ncbi:MAG: hypothetical protein WA055_02650 [Candidatus Moraniibacteriota bacterium]
MATQISHIVYAKKYFNSLELVKFDDLTAEEKLLMPSGKINKDEFILGCVFPDIRYIDENIKRKDSHLKFETLDLNFSGLTSFEAGWKFHLYCDMRREEILNKYNFYSFKNDTKFYIQAAKRLEDELVYDFYDNWEKVRNYFNNPPFKETDIGVDIQTFKLWYAMVAKYIENKPDHKSIRIFSIKILKNSENIDEIIKSINELRKNEKIVEILKKVKDEIV